MTIFPNNDLTDKNPSNSGKFYNLVQWFPVGSCPYEVKKLYSVEWHELDSGDVNIYNDISEYIDKIRWVAFNNGFVLFQVYIDKSKIENFINKFNIFSYHFKNSHKHIQQEVYKFYDDQVNSSFHPVFKELGGDLYLLDDFTPVLSCLPVENENYRDIFKKSISDVDYSIFKYFKVASILNSNFGQEKSGKKNIDELSILFIRKKYSNILSRVLLSVKFIKYRFENRDSTFHKAGKLQKNSTRIYKYFCFLFVVAIIKVFSEKLDDDYIKNIITHIFDNDPSKKNILYIINKFCEFFQCSIASETEFVHVIYQIYDSRIYLIGLIFILLFIRLAISIYNTFYCYLKIFRLYSVSATYLSYGKVLSEVIGRKMKTDTLSSGFDCHLTLLCSKKSSSFSAMISHIAAIALAMNVAIILITI